jgi:(p)ppGpp synthase/HD superfamily hydrolase
MPTDLPMDDGVDVILGPRFVRALEWAARLHAKQHKKGGHTPYVAHLLGTAALVLEGGGTEKEAIAALLHDAIEDAGVSADKIKRRFGGKVARIVVACTDLPGAGGHRGGKKRRKQRTAGNWRKRKQRSLTHLRAPDVPIAVLRVRAADALYNARSIVADLRRIGPEVWQRFHAGAVDQLWYYRSLSIVLSDRLPGYLSDELRVTVRDMEELAGWWFDIGDPQPGRRKSD